MANMLFYRDPHLPFLEAKRCAADELAYHKHFHEEYSIGLIRAGRTHAWCDGQTMQVEEGKVITFPPHMLHACHPDADHTWYYDMLFIHPDWFRQLETQQLQHIHIPYLLADRKNDICRTYILNIMHALHQGQSPLAVETGFIHLLHAITGSESGDWEHRQSHDERKYIQLVGDYLEAHFNENVTMEQLEQVSGISRFHLIRLFKKSKHLPPHAYQNILRINYAKRELHQRSIAEVAAEAGFYDQSHFTRMFTRMVGVTPRKYTLSV